MSVIRDAPDVLVIGAGLAGLACARDLSEAGHTVRVLEACDGVGGRMRSDRHDGFVIDRGFQVFNTSYPQVRRRLTLRDLRLRPFTAGCWCTRTAGRCASATRPAARTRSPICCRGGSRAPATSRPSAS
ncbi:hypothetical protein SAVCW2_73870 [Streptomyces avermitilis]|nr:hypothetical protein SAVCW2_73870 [Streptomyces avermitilis]